MGKIYFMTKYKMKRLDAGLVSSIYPMYLPNLERSYEKVGFLLMHVL